MQSGFRQDSQKQGKTVEGRKRLLVKQTKKSNRTSNCEEKKGQMAEPGVQGGGGGKARMKANCVSLPGSQIGKSLVRT